METNEFFLSSIRIEDLKNIIREVMMEFQLKQEVKDIPPDEELMTKNEVALKYKISLVTLRQWEKDGEIPKPFRKRSRVYFRKSEIMNDIKVKNQKQK
jgi:hypothetical protein